jgi:Mg/Co/Ni transporter MgtE
MSPRAAWRLESLGFEQVFDYVAGKQDWFANGLWREGQQASIRHAGDVADRTVLTCKPTDPVGLVRDRVRADNADVCVVVNDQHVVLGLLRSRALNADADVPVETVMDSGPSTFRPSAPVAEMENYFREHDLDSALITTSDGVLIGLLRQADA